MIAFVFFYVMNSKKLIVQTALGRDEATRRHPRTTMTDYESDTESNIQDDNVQYAFGTYGKHYICKTGELEQLARRAIKRGYNRILLDHPQFLHPHGKHILSAVLADHTNIKGQVTVRAKVMYKHTLHDEGQFGFLDISPKDWRRYTQKVFKKML